MSYSKLKLFLGSRYNVDFFSNGHKYSNTLDREGIIVFKSFISESGIDLLKNEAKNLKNLSFESSSDYNVYVSEYNNSFSQNSPRNRLMSTSKKCIPNDLVPKDSLLQLIYDSQLIKNFFCDILKKKQLHPYEDPLSSININYYDPGDALGWHFDNSDFTITLLVKNCEKGGVYEFFNNIRFDKHGNEDYDTVGKILDSEIQGTTVNSNEGDLMIFRGSKSIHQVTPVEIGERILVTFNYNEKRGISLSEKSRETFFGRLN